MEKLDEYTLNEYNQPGYQAMFQDIVLLVMKSFGPFNLDVPNQKLFQSFIEEMNKNYMMPLFTALGVAKLREFIHQPDRSDSYLDFINRLQVACTTVGFNETELNNFLLSTYNIMATDEILKNAYKDILPDLVCVDKQNNIYSLIATYGLVHCYLLLYKVLVPYFYNYLDKEMAKAVNLAEQRAMQEKRKQVMRELTSEKE